MTKADIKRLQSLLQRWDAAEIDDQKLYGPVQPRSIRLIRLNDANALRAVLKHLDRSNTKEPA